MKGDETTGDHLLKTLSELRPPAEEGKNSPPRSETQDKELTQSEEPYRRLAELFPGIVFLHRGENISM